MPPDHTVGQMVLERGPLFHLAGSLLLGLTWFICRHVPLSIRALQLLDFATLLAADDLHADGPEPHGCPCSMALSTVVGIQAGLLAAANCILARAIAVPSTGARTFWVSTAAMLPLVPATFIATRDPGTIVNIVCWCARDHRDRDGRLARDLRPAA